MILLPMQLGVARREYWHTQPVAVAVTRGDPAGMEEVRVCEWHDDGAWDRLTQRRNSTPLRDPYGIPTAEHREPR